MPKSKPKPQLDAFAPDHLKEVAKESGFLHCRTCGLVWFGGPPGATTCPEGPRGRPVHVVLLCRDCNRAVPVKHLQRAWAALTGRSRMGGRKGLDSVSRSA